MEYYVELKLREDAHNGWFSNGLSFSGNESTRSLVKTAEADNKIIYENNKGHVVTLNMHRNSDTLELSTSFKNNGTETATLELLSSFAIKGIKADKIHRLQSFWSAEGKLRTETIHDLTLNPHGTG